LDLVGAKFTDVRSANELHTLRASPFVSDTDGYTLRV